MFLVTYVYAASKVLLSNIQTLHSFIGLVHGKDHTSIVPRALPDTDVDALFSKKDKVHNLFTLIDWCSCIRSMPLLVVLYHLPRPDAPYKIMPIIPSKNLAVLNIFT